MLGRLLALATRAPRATLAFLVALAVAGGVVGVLVPVDGRLDRLAPSGSASERAGETERASFGGDTALIVVRGDMVTTLLNAPDLIRLTTLEGCLAGQVPPTAKKSVCTKIRDLKAVKSVEGPATYVNSALAEIQNALTDRTDALKSAAATAKSDAEAAAKKKGWSQAQITKAGEAASSYVTIQGYAALGQYAKDSGLEKLADASLVNRDFIKSVLFAKGADNKLGPKRRLAALIPNRQTAIIQVHLVGDLSAGKRGEVTKALQAAMNDAPFQLSETKATYQFTGLAPATQTLSDAIRRSALALGVAALIVMALVLSLARRLRRRLLPVLVAASVLGVALVALAIPTGALSLAVVVALPVLVGLAVDQAVQAQLRLERRMHPAALRTLVIAGGAAAASTLALIGSPFAVVRTVGVALAAAILVAIVFAAMASAAAISLGKRRDPASTPSPFVSAARDADELLASSPPVRGGRAAGVALSMLASRITRTAAIAVILAGLVLALGGAAISSQTRVETNLTALVPSDSSGARQLEQLRKETGAASTVSLLVKTKQLGSPALWRYLVAAQRTAAAGGNGRCDGEGLCNPVSLDELFGTTAKGALPTDAQVSATLAALPQAISRSLIDPDRGVIALPFGIGTLDGAAQRTLVGKLERIAAASPGGTEIAVSGLPAVVASSAAALESPGRRALLALLAIGLPALVLLATLRSPRRTIVALVPPAFALGWSELAMWLLGVPRTPLTAALGVLVAAVAVEFSVLLSERYAALRRVGLARDRAIASTLRETGGAVAISAGATIAGFAILGVASIPVISEFGIATAVDLALVLLALVAVGPATWVLADRELAPARRPATGQPLSAR